MSIWPQSLSAERSRFCSRAMLAVSSTTSTTPQSSLVTHDTPMSMPMQQSRSLRLPRMT
jgi:hypothetical protein